VRPLNAQALLERLAKESSVNAHLSHELRTASMRLETAEASRNHLHERLKQIESECDVSQFRDLMIAREPLGFCFCFRYEMMRVQLSTEKQR
jgi:hypothetical protein